MRLRPRYAPRRVHVHYTKSAGARASSCQTAKARHVEGLRDDCPIMRNRLVLQQPSTATKPICPSRRIFWTRLRRTAIRASAWRSANMIGESNVIAFDNEGACPGHAEPEIVARRRLRNGRLPVARRDPTRYRTIKVSYQDLAMTARQTFTGHRPDPARNRPLQRRFDLA